MGTSFDDATIHQIVETAIQHPQFLLLKSQQRGEEEPSLEEKRSVLENLLKRDRALFLEKYGKFLDEASLRQFERFKDDYEVSWHLNQLLPKLQNAEKYQKATEHQKRNRRFRYMQQHLLNTDFFSNENMRLRSPALYHALIGKYQGVEEFEENLPLSEKLLKNIDYSESERRRREEEAQDNEYDSDSEVCDHNQKLNTDNKSNEKKQNSVTTDENQMKVTYTQDNGSYSRKSSSDAENTTASMASDTVRVPTRHFGELREQNHCSNDKEKLRFLELFTKFITNNQKDEVKKTKGDDDNSRDSKCGEDETNTREPHPQLSEEEKKERANTLLELMKQKFINGEDSEFFDYR
jgi:hypothetical protein